MSSFVRRDTNRWRRDVPGARWFKADLHIHTVDDLPGGRAKWPSGVSGSQESEEALTSYSRRFLQCAAERGVRVLGITPHSPRMGNATGVSAVWRIVEEWNDGVDDDGTPFRDKVYAVFPGFEPSFQAGEQRASLAVPLRSRSRAGPLPQSLRSGHGRCDAVARQCASGVQQERHRRVPRPSRLSRQGVSRGARRRAAVALPHARAPYRNRQGPARRPKSSGAA